MMEKLIYRHTPIIVAMLFSIGALIAFAALRNTCALLFEYFELRSTLALMPDISLHQASTKQSSSFPEIDLNSVLFNTITEAAGRHDIKVKNIDPPVLSNSADFIIVTEEVKLEGGFVSTMKCLDDAILELRQVKLSSLKFERDLTGRSDVLITTAYFQTIIRNENKAHD